MTAMFKPAFALFRKEFRQHRNFVTVMVAACVMAQTGYCCWVEHWLNQPLHQRPFFLIAFFFTALFTGAAAAVSYSGEHSEKTFTFLRSLPVTPLTIALGKTGFILAGTLLVLFGNFAAAGLWVKILWADISLQYETYAFCHDFFRNKNYILALGLPMVEVFVWGLYWSTRCRSSIYAVIAAAVSCLLLWTVCDEYLTSSPVFWRSLFAAAAAALAVRGMLNWFARERRQFADGRRQHFVKFLLPSAICRLLTPRYPQKVQTPFWALVHHLLRHGSGGYLLGILSSLAFCSGCLILMFSKTAQGGNLGENIYWVSACWCSVAGLVAFCGLIFGHDQKNDSYRFFSRCGIPYGKIWQSRILPAFLVYLPVYILFQRYLFFEYIQLNRQLGVIEPYRVYPFFAGLFSVWLIPFAAGAYCSVSIRRLVVAVGMTAAGTLILLLWMCLMGYFEYNPLWTTVPLCLALLAASRIQTRYWIQETKTWKSRFIAASPIIVTLILICAVLPPIRIYSVPNITWRELETLFDQAGMPKRMSAEKRRAIEQFSGNPETLPDFDFRRFRNLPDTELFIKGFKLDAQLQQDNLLQYVREHLQSMKASIGTCPCFEEFLFSHYARMKRYLFYPDQEILRENTEHRIATLLRMLPWEREHAERALRLSMAAAFAEAGILRTERAEQIRRTHYQLEKKMVSDVDRELWTMAYDALAYQAGVCRLQTELVTAALYCRYLEHNETLPKSLDELVGKYLDALPVHPFTKEKMSFRWMTEEEILEKFGGEGPYRGLVKADDKTCYFLRRKPSNADAVRPEGSLVLSLGDSFVRIEEYIGEYDKRQ